MKTDLIQALVIGTQPYGENTLLVKLLTRDAGVVRGMARGARRGGKIASAGGTPWEAFNWVEAHWSQTGGGDALGNLSKAEAREGWPWLRSDLPRLAYAGLGLEIMSLLAASAPAESYYFDETTRFFTLLETARGPGSLTGCLLLRLLHHAGFPPRLGVELAPQLQNPENLPTRLAYHFHTHELTRAHATDPSHAQRLGAEVVLPLLSPENYFEHAPELERELGWTARSGPTGLRWLVRIWEDHLQTRFKSMAFLEEMVLGKRPRGNN